MAIQWADDFTRYGTGSGGLTAMQDGLPYTNWLSRPVADPDPLATGSRCISIDTTGANNNPYVSNYISVPTPTAGTVGVASRYWFTGFGSGSSRQVLAAWLTVGLTGLASLIVEPTGALTIRTGVHPGTDIASTSGPILATNSWNHVESEYNGTTGEMEVRVNGVTVLTGTSGTLDTIAIVSAQTRNTTGAEGPNFYMKDFIIRDDSGATNNTWLGTVQCLRRKPVADVTLGGWLPSTGSTGFDLLAKDAVNDTTYLSADDTPPAAMQYSLADLPADTTSVRALVTVVRARKVDGGDANIQVSMISNGDAGPGADRPITTAFTYYYDVNQLSPDTGLPWTPQEFNDSTSEIDRTI